MRWAIGEFDDAGPRKRKRDATRRESERTVLSGKSDLVVSLARTMPAFSGLGASRWAPDSSDSTTTRFRAPKPTPVWKQNKNARDHLKGKALYERRLAQQAGT